MELIAKGWSALQEVDRVIDYCELNDKRLIPFLRVIFILKYETFKFFILFFCGIYSYEQQH